MNRVNVNPLLKNKRHNGADSIQTDKEDVRPLLKYIPKAWKIWEPACGEGQIVDFLRDEQYQVIATDITGGFDFFSPLAAQQGDYDCIVTNPPYSIKDEWLERCYELGKPFALFLPVTVFDSKFRRALFRKHATRFLMPDDRPTFTMPSGKKGGSWFYAIWVCHGLDLPEQVTYAEAA